MNIDDEYDFSQAKRAKDIPHLAKLQQASKGKSRITIMLDDDVLNFFRSEAEAKGIGYQTLINMALREAMSYRPLNEITLRRILREELGEKVGAGEMTR